MERKIESLTAAHVVADFTCGDEWLDNYLQKMALANQKTGYGRSYVAVPRDGSSKEPHGFYTVSMSSIQFAHLPPPLRYKSMPKYPMPAAHLGCLAVATQYQRQGLGSLLLIDALQRILAASELVATRAVDVLASSQAAREWYLSLGFLEFENMGEKPPYHLYLPMDTVQRIVVAAKS